PQRLSEALLRAFRWRCPDRDRAKPLPRDPLEWLGSKMRAPPFKALATVSSVHASTDRRKALTTKVVHLCREAVHSGRTGQSSRVPHSLKRSGARGATNTDERLTSNLFEEGRRLCAALRLFARLSNAEFHTQAISMTWPHRAHTPRERPSASSAWLPGPSWW